MQVYLNLSLYSMIKKEFKWNNYFLSSGSIFITTSTNCSDLYYKLSSLIDPLLNIYQLFVFHDGHFYLFTRNEYVKVDMPLLNLISAKYDI